MKFEVTLEEVVSLSLVVSVLALGIGVYLLYIT